METEVRTWDLTLVVHVAGSPAHRGKVLQWVSDVMSHRQKGSLPYAGGSLLCAGCLVFVSEIPCRLGKWVWGGSLCRLKYFINHVLLALLP